MEHLLNIFNIRLQPFRKVIQKATATTLPDCFSAMTFVASRQQTVQRDELVYLYFKKFQHHNFSLAIIPLEGRNRAMYMNTESLKKIYLELLSSIDTKSKFLLHLKRYSQLIRKYHKAEINFKNSTLNKKNLLKNFSRYLKLTEKTGDFAWMPYAIENVIDAELKTYLKKQFPNNWQEYFEVLSSPTQLHTYQVMRKDICEMFVKGKITLNDIYRFVQKYWWYGEYSYVEDLYDIKYFMNEIGKLTLQDAKEEIYKISKEIECAKMRYAEVLSLIKDSRARLCAEIINTYVFLRTDRTDTRKRLQASYRTVLDNIALCLSADTFEVWTRKDVANLLNSEIEMYLKGMNLPNKSLITERANNYLYLRDKNGITIFSDGKTIQNAVQEIVGGISTPSDIKGFSAFKGLVTGPVVFVSEKADLSKVFKGAVLVARTTMVDYIEAMERASAIITDEGGVTSHAAIVARELKKPCIVGTKNATKLLKSADMVEVDANNGLVKLLMRS
jgi:phosphohistidine swiveling domain-containing protein